MRLVVPVLALVALAGTAQAQEPAATIRLLDFRFEPAVFTVPPGATIALVGEGVLDDHTFTSADDAHPFDVIVRKGETKNLTLPAIEGGLRFYCRLHAGPTTEPEQGMAGRVTLAAADEERPAGNNNDVPLPAPLAAAALLAAALARRR